MDQLALPSPTSSFPFLDMDFEALSGSNKLSIWRGFDSSEKSSTDEESKQLCTAEKTNAKKETGSYCNLSPPPSRKRGPPKCLDIINLVESDSDKTEDRSAQLSTSLKKNDIEVIVIDDDGDNLEDKSTSPRKRKESSSPTEHLLSQFSDHKEEIKWKDAQIHYLESELKKRYSLESQLEQAQKERERQEVQIKLLETKLTERYDLEMQLNQAKEKIQSLEISEVNLRQELTKMKLIEWECQYLHTSLRKCKDDDKRNKENFERQLINLKNSENALKLENEKLVSKRIFVEKNMLSLKEKLHEAEIKLKKAADSKPASGLGSSDEYCCNIKDKLVDLLDKEYSCSICGDLFIDATITECNHIFCKYCLGSWKARSNQCPFCRANIIKESKANVIDDCITTLTKLISDSKHEERLQLIKERKALEGPPAKRARVVSDFLEVRQPELMSVRPPDFFRTHPAELLVHRARELFGHQPQEVIASRPADLIGARSPWLY